LFYCSKSPSLILKVHAVYLLSECMALWNAASRQQHSISAPKVEAAILFLDTGTQSLGLPLQNAHRLYSFTCLI